MDNKEIKQTKDQTITINNQSNLTITGTNKIISLKPDLIQLDTIYGLVVVGGSELELKQLDNTTSKAEITGKIFSLKFSEPKEKENILRKIFK